MDTNSQPATPTSTHGGQLEQAQLETLINSITDGVIATDQNGKITTYNGATLNILDSNTELKGTPIGLCLRLVDKEQQPIDLTRLILDTKTQTISREYRLVYSDGSLINIYLSIAPVKPKFGSEEKNGFVIMIRDITREKSLEEERDEFVSVVSHELRTPVTIAEGNLSNAILAIDRQDDVISTKNAIHQAHDQILFLGSLINDLSTLSRAENDTIQNLNYVSINVAQLVQNLAQNYVQEVEKKGLNMRTEIDPTLEVIYNSSLYVREILQNFVTNAIKYTEHGVITIGAKSTQGGVNFTVSDTGIGISEHDQKEVFGKFFRSEDYRTRKSSGTGLGLYVTTKLAKLIGAKVTLESTLNKGSTFTIFVPNMGNTKQSQTN
ncbi:PAS domain S-box protein [Candidatus Saccharibacteria bacterium]|nr:PAS domain S-box protein [Candidatus Saccharibacteria bacterium]